MERCCAYGRFLAVWSATRGIGLPLSLHGASQDCPRVTGNPSVEKLRLAAREPTSVLPTTRNYLALAQDCLCYVYRITLGDVRGELLWHDYEGPIPGSRDSWADC